MPAVQYRRARRSPDDDLSSPSNLAVLERWRRVLDGGDVYRERTVRSSAPQKCIRGRHNDLARRKAIYGLGPFSRSRGSREGLRRAGTPVVNVQCATRTAGARRRDAARGTAIHGLGAIWRPRGIGEGLRTSGTPVVNVQGTRYTTGARRNDAARGTAFHGLGAIRQSQAIGEGLRTLGTTAAYVQCADAHCRSAAEHVDTVLLAGRRFMVSGYFCGLEAAGKGSEGWGHQSWARGARRALQEDPRARWERAARRAAISCVGPSTDRTSPTAFFCHYSNASSTRPDHHDASSGRRTVSAMVAFPFSLLVTRAPIVWIIGPVRKRQRECSIPLRNDISELTLPF